MSLRRAQNIFMPNNINSITINITLEVTEKKKLKKMKTNHSEEYFFHQRCEKTSTNFEMASPFWLAAYIVRLFDSHFLLVYFSGLKCILAHQIHHFSPQNGPQCPTKKKVIIIEHFIAVFHRQISLLILLLLLLVIVVVVVVVVF